ncbi:MAG: hypothetical protein UV38_C0003G0007 [candidate division TM6 bacterium GW2011_GWE2_42_60]|nr:MAG: hypothetical protein UV38_C0003G0007 [candidate division TM6 bacterium GW2011_GWE2_42_60]HBY05936.1 hypothetical protein [Candidatus Dependentiae bacterium]
MTIKNKIAVLVGILIWSFGAGASDVVLDFSNLSTTDSDCASITGYMPTSYNLPNKNNTIDLATSFPLPEEKIKSSSKNKEKTALLNKTTVPFATHSLIIVPETKPNEKGSRNIIESILASKLLVLFSATMIQSFEAKSLCGEYYFFGLPGALESKGKDFILGVPEEMLDNDLKNAFRDPKTKSLNNNSSITATKMEKKLGFFITHLHYLGTLKTIGEKKLELVNQKEENLANGLKNILSNFFVPNKLYKNKMDKPRWIMVFDGHAPEAILYTNVSDIDKNKTIVKDATSLASLKISDIAEIIDAIMERTELMLVQFTSCYGGIIKLTELLEKLSLNPPIFTSMSFTGNGQIAVSSGTDRYKLFLNSFLDCQLEKKEFKNREKLHKKIFEKFTKAIPYLDPKAPDTARGHNIPVFKSPTDTHFWPVPSFCSTKIIQAKDLKSQPELKAPYIVLLDGTPIENIKVNIFKLKDSKKEIASPYFSAGVPGSFAQVIKQLNVQYQYKTCTDILKELFPDMFEEKVSEYLSYCVHIKNIKGIAGCHKAKIYAKIAKNNKCGVGIEGIDAVFSYQENKNSPIKKYYFFDKTLEEKRADKDSKKEALLWIKTFKEEIENKKKLQACMQNYLFPEEK